MNQICNTFDLNKNQDITLLNIQKVLKITLPGMSKEEKILNNHPVFPSWLCERIDFKTYYNNNIKFKDDNYNILKIELLLNSKPEERSLSDLQILMKWLKLKNILTKVKQGRLLEVCKQLHLLLSPISTEIIKQGEPGDAFYIVLDGYLDVIVDGTIVVAKLQSGNIFGEKALDNDAPRAATVKTTSNCKLMMLTASEYKNLIHSSHAKIIHELSSFFHDNVSLFSSISLPRVKNLVKLMVTLPFKDEQIIIEQGKIGGGLCIIKSGQVAIVRKILNDNNNSSNYSQGATIIPVIVSILSNGSIFGDDSFRRDNKNKYSAVALGPVEIIIFNKKDVLNYLDKKFYAKILSSTSYLHIDDSLLLQKYLTRSRRKNYYNTLKNEACGKLYMKRKYIGDVLNSASNNSRLLSNKSYENLLGYEKNNYKDTIAQDKFNEDDDTFISKIQNIIFNHDSYSRQGHQGTLDIFLEAENVARRSSFCQRKQSNHDIYARRGSVRRISVGSISESISQHQDNSSSTLGRRNSITIPRKSSVPFLPTIVTK